MEFQEVVEGKIIVRSSSSISHYGIRLAVNGSVNLQVRIFPCLVPDKINERQTLQFLYILFFFLKIVSFITECFRMKRKLRSITELNKTGLINCIF